MDSSEQVRPPAVDALGDVHAQSSDPAGLVSVVMIFRNPGDFFEEAVESVLAQTYPRVELVLCDDGSDGPATESATARAASNPGKVVYADHPEHAHRGMSATRNLGLAKATGEFVAFLDADDVWAPDHLALEMSMLTAHPEADAVCGGAVTWRSWSGAGVEDETPPTAFPTGTIVRPPLMLEALLRRAETATPTCSLLVRASALRATGGSEDGFTGMYEDQALLAKLFVAHTVVIGGSTTAFYRQHAASNSAIAITQGSYHPSKPNAARTNWLIWLRSLVDAKGSESGVRTLIDAELAGLHSARRSRRLRRAVAAAVGPRREAATAPLRWLALKTGRVLQRATLLALPPTPRQPHRNGAQSIDRHYTELFLARSAYLVRGSVLEIGDALHAERSCFATEFDIQATSLAAYRSTATLSDLETPGALPENVYDCILLVGTLHRAWDLHTAVTNVWNALRPGGAALVTVPSVPQVSSDGRDGGWNWAVSPTAALRLFERTFGGGQVEVECFGNVRSAAAILDGFGVRDLRASQLQAVDRHRPVLITVRAWRPSRFDGCTYP